MLRHHKEANLRRYPELLAERDADVVGGRAGFQHGFAGYAFNEGNKCDMDLQRQVGRDSAKLYAEGLQMTYFEVSARNGLNVNEVFQRVS